MLLKEIVRDTLSNYFNNLGKDKPQNLYHVFLSEVEKPLFQLLRKETRYNQVLMAKYLGISRGTLRKKLKIHGMI